MFSTRVVLRNCYCSCRTPFKFGYNLCSSAAASSHSVDSSEVSRFSKLASEWWRENGPFRALHAMNELRIPLIVNGVGESVPKQYPLPLAGLRILDVGCGAGILSEPLSRLGAEVVGIDASLECVEVAKVHANGLTTGPRYLNVSLEGLLTEDGEAASYDVVVASEILEHVAEREPFVKSCVSATKPGGLLVFTTLNRTTSSKVLGIWAAERILKIVPEGVHTHDKFTPPEDLKSMLELQECGVRKIQGMGYNPFTNRFWWSSDKSINYALCAYKLVSNVV